MKAIFQFPSSIHGLQTIDSSSSLKQSLSELAGLQQTKCSYRISVNKHIYLYARCSHVNCKSYLRYRRNQNDQYELIAINKNHKHSLSSSKNFRLEAVRSYLKQVPSSIETATLKKLVCQQFMITEKQFYYLYKQVRQEKIELQDLIQNFQRRGYLIYLSKEERQKKQPPELFIAVSELMKDQFKTYGDLTSFDLTFNMINHIHPSGSKFKIGCMLGLTSAKRITPFAFVVTLRTAKEDYVRIFRTFFEIMGRAPIVIVSDEERAIHAALVELQSTNEFNGVHLLDAYHILHNVRKKLKEKEHLLFFKKALHARNKQHYQECIRQAEQHLTMQDLSILRKFQAGAAQYCFSHIPNIFIGLSSTSSPNECLHSLLKSIQRTQKSYPVAVRNILNYLQMLGTKSEKAIHESTPFQTIFHLPQLSILRKMLCKTIFNYLVQEIAKSMKCEMREINSSLYIVYDHGHTFELSRDLKDILACSCGFLVKAGLPCSHILRVSIISKLSIISQMPDRWMLKRSISFEIPQATNQRTSTHQLGRQRNSKKKMIT